MCDAHSTVSKPDLEELNVSVVYLVSSHISGGQWGLCSLELHRLTQVNETNESSLLEQRKELRVKGDKENIIITSTGVNH